MLWAFVDESKANDYILAMVVAEPSVAIALEKKLVALRLPGQRRIHFSKESDQRRRMILDQIAKFDLEVYFFTNTSKNEATARKACLLAALTTVRVRNVKVIFIERDESVMKADLSLLKMLVSDLQFQLLEPHQKAGLWAADALAWAKFRGGKYWAKISHLEKLAGTT